MGQKVGRTLRMSMGLKDRLGTVVASSFVVLSYHSNILSRSLFNDSDADEPQVFEGDLDDAGLDEEEYVPAMISEYLSDVAFPAVMTS